MDRPDRYVPGGIMKRAALWIVALTLIGLVPSTPPLAADETILMGTFVWSAQGTESDLKAVFTPTGDDRWDVDFHFKFRGTNHTYSGTAEGNLTEGELSGTVKNETKRRTFTFEGSFKEGVFRGIHAEIEDGEPFDTGTMALSR
jgi:hypothetical protein